MREMKANLHYLTICILAYECNYVASWMFQIGAQSASKENSIILLHTI
jgi:hypothetical protein